MAIIEIVDQFKLSGPSKARPVVLPSASDVNFNSSTKFTVSGWGCLKPSRIGPRGRWFCPKPYKLHSASVTWISEQDCKTNYGSSISSSVLCAGDFANGGVDACTWDSGGMCENGFY